MVRTIGLNALKGQRSLSFGRDEGATVRLKSIQTIQSGTKFELKVDGHSFEGMIPLFGEHQAMNAAAAAPSARAWHTGSGNAQWVDLSISNGRRMRRVSAASGFEIIDDATMPTLVRSRPRLQLYQVLQESELGVVF